MSTAGMFQRAQDWTDRTAITAAGSSYDYGTLLRDSEAMAHQICQKVGKSDLKQEHVGFLANPGYKYVVAQWAVWRAGLVHH